jgi:hypothetical protein
VFSGSINEARSIGSHINLITRRKQPKVRLPEFTRVVPVGGYKENPVILILCVHK